jgi:deoxyribonuclease-1
MKMKKLISMLLVLFPVLTFSATVYYPTDFLNKINNHQIKDEALKAEIFSILSESHTRLSNGNDLVGCFNNQGKCFQHKAVGYGPARHYLYSQLHVTNNDSRGPILKDVYCHREIPAVNAGDPKDINCEHTWPQSKFTRAFDNELQKSDMHHLFPTDSRANSTRGNFDFAEVSTNKNLVNCTPSKSGSSVTSGGDNYFEPPMEHKGNVARALFYFAVRYKMTMNPAQEAFLRKWNDQDPVDDAEMERNNQIEKLQGDRNPFIDFPNLVDDIRKF